MDALLTLKRKLSQMEQVFMPAISPLFASAAGAIKAGGADCVMIDTEHTPINPETLRGALASCRNAGLPSIVRVADTMYHFISQTFDAGADGVMIPRTECVKQARITVESSKFPPVGKKGCGGPGIFRPGESTQDFNNNRVILLQTESAKGIDALPDIFERFEEHIDGVVAGPADLSISLGVPLEYNHVLVERELMKMISICRRYKKPCGMYMQNLETARLWSNKGMSIMWVSSDTEFIIEGTAAISARLRAKQ